MNLKKEKSTALLAARQAGKVLLHYYGRKEKIKEKSNKSLVATADLEANKAIIKTIKEHFPGHNILSEETGFEDNKSDYKWVIDPLDGTHNFLHEIPIFGTSIALEYKGEVIVGILHFPILKITAVAEKGKGAFLNGKRINVSNKKNINHAFFVFEYAFGDRRKKLDFLEKFINEMVDLRNFGSAIYGLLMLACGNLDGYVIYTTNEWDMAAGALIVIEAGGIITDIQGSKWKPAGGSFVISNVKLHNKLLKYVK